VADLTTFSSGKLEIYFNSKRAGIDGQLTQRLVDFIDATQTSLDVAIYDLTSPAVLKALAAVAKSGKQLRIAFDASGERRTNATVDPKPGKTHAAIRRYRLARHATPVYMTGRHLMHDKFAIRDGKAVWTGSANFTNGGLTLQDNTCMRAGSVAMAQLYQPVFEALVTEPTTLAAPTPAKSIKVGGAQISVYFAPSAGEGIDQLCTELRRQRLPAQQAPPAGRPLRGGRLLQPLRERRGQRREPRADRLPGHRRRVRRVLRRRLQERTAERVSDSQARRPR
jgi:phosphatidylserine/phosphatidylglycerophosphate/cardiolipin synthase-like enzyme